MKILYFILFYVALGTAGITLPLLINQEFVPAEVSIGLVTVVMSSVGYNSSEKIMQLYDEKSNKKGAFFFNLVSLVIALLFTIYVCIRISDKFTLYIAAFAYVLSCAFWWYQNWNNKNLENTSAPDTLGGSIEQFNKP